MKKKIKYIVIALSSVIILFFGYKYFSIKIKMYLLSEHVVYWKPNVIIKSQDFKKTPNSNNSSNVWSYHAIVLESTGLKNANAKAYFDKDRSWIKDSLDSNLEKDLISQKIIFDLYEVYARKFNKRIDLIRENKETSFSELNLIGKDIYNKVLMEQNEFYNSKLPVEEKNKIWRELVDEMLNEENVNSENDI